MRYFKKCIFIFPIILFSLLITGCNESAWEKHLNGELQTDKNLLEVLSGKPELSVFVAMLQKTGYSEVLKNANSYTVFAASNSAWAGVDTSNVELMRKTVGMLIIYNSYFSDDNRLYTSVKAVNTKSVFYNVTDKTFNGAKILTADIPAANGVIHITDKIVERKESVWDFMSQKSANLQYLYVKSLNKSVMDNEKSIAIGVYPDGKTKFDTIWKNINNFLIKYPIDNEDSVYTYILMSDAGFNNIYNKYKPYFNLGLETRTDSVTRFNVCQDVVFKGIIDISKFDTIVNVDGVKIGTKDIQIVETYNASNGRVYVVNQMNIKLKDKIKPIQIEGESFKSASSANYVYTRYKRWASGERDVALSSAETQTDSLWRMVPLAPDTEVKKDSVASKTYYVNSGLVANLANFHIEYKAKVNSCPYDVYYVAYDDIADHFDPTYKKYGVYKIVQKLFFSMPGDPVLKFGIAENTRGVANNYLGAARCFVGQGMAGVHEITKLRQMNLTLPSQIVGDAVTSPNADLLSVNKTGELTMWLCNTARSTSASRQGLLFLDYILLVPRITEE